LTTFNIYKGSYNLIQNRGHKGSVLRPRCIGPGEGPYPNYDSILFYYISFPRRIILYAVTPVNKRKDPLKITKFVEAEIIKRSWNSPDCDVMR